jgi:cobalt-zinc-cadmium resistance protein CzcA
MSLGALDFGLIVDGAVIIVENCLRRFGEAQHRLGRLLTATSASTLAASATAEVIRPSLFGIFIITAVYLPIFALTGVEGKMFHPMASRGAGADRRDAAVADLRAGGGRAVRHRQGRKRRTASCAGIKRRYARCSTGRCGWRCAVVLGAAAWWRSAALASDAAGFRVHPQPRRRRHRAARAAHPGHQPEPGGRMQRRWRRASSKFPEVERVFAKIGTAEVATDPMPPSVADTFMMLKDRANGPIRASPRPAGRRDRAAVWPDSRQQLRVHPADPDAHERADRRRARRCGDQGLRRRSRQLLESAKDREPWSTVSRRRRRQARAVTGLPVLSSSPTAQALAATGLSGGRAGHGGDRVGGEEAGQMFEGDRRFDIVVRLPEAPAHRSAALADLPIRLPAKARQADESSRRRAGAVGAARRPRCRCAKSPASNRAGPNQISRENGKRRVVSPPTCAAATSGSSSPSCASAVAAEGRTVPRRLLDRLRRHLRAADLGQPAPAVVVPLSRCC